MAATAYQRIIIAITRTHTNTHNIDGTSEFVWRICTETWHWQRAHFEWFCCTWFCLNQPSHSHLNEEMKKKKLMANKTLRTVRICLWRVFVDVAVDIVVDILYEIIVCDVYFARQANSQQPTDHYMALSTHPPAQNIIFDAVSLWNIFGGKLVVLCYMATITMLIFFAISSLRRHCNIRKRCALHRAQCGFQIVTSFCIILIDSQDIPQDAVIVWDKGKPLWGAKSKPPWLSKFINTALSHSKMMAVSK